MKILTKYTAYLFGAFLLTGCMETTSPYWMTPAQINQAHNDCGIGSAPLETYRACMTNVYNQDGGVNPGRMEFLAMVDAIAEAVRLGNITQTQGYARIASFRAEDARRYAAAEAARQEHNRRVWAESMQQQQQETNQIFNNLLNNQNNGISSDYWQVHQNGTTVQCRRWGTQVSCQ